MDVNAIHELLINLFQGGGVYSYSGGSAFTNWVADVTGANLGDGLTGRHFTTFVQVTDPVTGVGKDDFYNNDFAAFFEDSWKVRPNLTLNLGVRYDMQLIPQPPKPNTTTPLTTLYTSTINIDKNNFAPRIGLAWSARKGHRASRRLRHVLRQDHQQHVLCHARGEWRVPADLQLQSHNLPGADFPERDFHAARRASAAPFAGALTPQSNHVYTPPALTQTTRGQVPDLVNPLVHEGEVTVEHQLPGNMSISASYVFSRALRLPMFIDTNLRPATTTKSYDITNLAGVTQSSFTEPFYTSRIDPTGPILTGFSDVNSWYNSMVLTLHRR